MPYTNRFVFGLTITTILGTNIAAAQSMQTEKLSVDDPRPVAAAVDELVTRFGYVITYEDARLIYRGDLDDATSRVRKDLNKYPGGNAPKVLVPLNSALAIDVPNSSSLSAADMSTLLQKLVQVQNSIGRGGHFRVEQAGDAFHVLPNEARDQDGNWMLQKSILDVSISLPTEDRDADSMINSICNAVSGAAKIQVGLTFSVGGISSPSNPQPYRLGADNERARDVLMRALNMLDAGQKRTWVLFYDTSENTHSYYLTIKAVPTRSATPVSTEAPKSSKGSSVSATASRPNN